MDNENLTIPVDELGNTQDPLALPPAQNPTDGLEEFTLVTPEEQQNVQEAQQQSEQATQNLFQNLFGDTQEAQRFNAEREAGIGDLTTQLKDIRNEEFQTSERFRREREALTVEAGLTAAQRNARLADIGRKQNTELADIAVRKYVASNDLSNAQAAVDRKLEFQFAEQKQKVEQLQFIANFYEGKQKKALEAVAKKEERAYQQAFNEQKAFANTQLAAMSNASLAGAGQAKIQALNKAKNMEEFLAAGGDKYLVSPKDKLEIQKLNVDINKSNAEYAKLLQEIGAAQGQLGGSTGDPIVDILSASSRYGDKRLTDSQLEKIQQAQQALGSLEGLQGLLSQGKDGVKLTGPLTGRARQLFSQFGADADAKAINATIQGLIPTVARGIFGEVGVLTDTDIENYKKTVPNLTSTEEQNKLVSLIMYDVLSRSVGNTLVTNAQNQANVSGFVPTYLDINKRIKSLKSELGIVEEIPVSDEANTYLDTQLGGGPVENINNAVSSYANQFTRPQ